MSSKINTGSSSTSKYNNYGSTSTILKGSVVFCQHGFLGNESTMNPLFENLKSHPYSNFYRCIFCDYFLSYSELCPTNKAIKEIKEKVNANPISNVFVRTLFSNPTYGDVSTQANELKEMINEVKKTYPNVPIVVVGYSKGGVVNCKCAIDNPGLIDRIINIGTPHDDTLVQDLINIIGDSCIEKYGYIGKIEIPLVRDAVQALVDLANSGVDAIMNEKIIYTELRNEWNKLTNKPKFIPIAGETIVVNGEFNGDFVVPTESAIASGFRGRTYNGIINNFIVDDDKVTIETSKIRNTLKNGDFLFDILGSFSEAIIGFDAVKIVEALYDIIYNVFANNSDLTKCLNLAHTSFLGHDDFILTYNTIGSRVLAGFNN